MFVVVSYDVACDRRRQLLAQVLEGSGTRVQLSVFECHLEPDEIDRLVERLAAVADPASDRIRLYTLCNRCVGTVRVLGPGTLTEDPDFFVV